MADCFVSIRTKRQLDILTNKAKEHPPQRDDASTVDAELGRVGRVEQGETRPGNSAPRGGPQLELSP